MITHVVLLQPKEGVAENEIINILHHVEELQHQIPGIIGVETGKNLSASNQGYTFGFIMRFTDIEHLQAFAPHPAHQLVSQELQGVCQKGIDFDIEQ